MVFVSRSASDRNPPEPDDYEMSAEFVAVAGISKYTALGPVDLAFLHAALAQPDVRRGR